MVLSRILLVFTLVLPACAASSADSDPVAADQEIKSVASTIYERAPMSGRRLEAWRTTVEEVDLGYAWGRNQGDVRGLAWEGGTAAPLDAAQREALVKEAFRFMKRTDVRDLKPVATDDASLGAALDAVGLTASSPTPETTAKRQELEDRLRDIARTQSVTVMTATLHDQVDMYWEGALVVVDEDNRQIVVATGGFGT